MCSLAKYVVSAQKLGFLIKKKVDGSNLVSKHWHLQVFSITKNTEKRKQCKVTFVEQYSRDEFDPTTCCI